MEQVVFRTLFILLQAAVGAVVLQNEIRLRSGGGRGGFRVPQWRHPAVFINDLFFWLSIFGWVAIGVTWFFYPDTRATFLTMFEPANEMLQWLGLFVAVLATYLIVAGIVNLGSSFRTSIDHGETPTLVTRGIYQFIRNPMALGLLLHGWAGFLLHQSWVAFGAAMILHITNRLRVHFEEKYLFQTLGEPYEEFCRKVGRFFPKGL